MPEPKKSTSLFHIFSACVNSWRGLCAAFQSEAAFRQEIYASIVFIPLAFILGHGVVQHAILFASWMLVLIVELLNTALEKAVDRISTELHPLSGQIKDVASAAVLLSLLQVIVVWAVIIL